MANKALREMNTKTLLDLARLAKANPRLVPNHKLHGVDEELRKARVELSRSILAIDPHSPEIKRLWADREVIDEALTIYEE